MVSKATVVRSPFYSSPSSKKNSRKEITSQRDSQVTNNTSLSQYLYSVLLLPHVHHSPLTHQFSENRIKSPPSICTAVSSPSAADLQKLEGEQSLPRHTQASRYCGADPPGPSQAPAASFDGETGSQLEILISINATVVSSRLLSRSIFPPTFLCASQTPPAVGSAQRRSTARYSALYGWSALIQRLTPARQETF